VDREVKSRPNILFILTDQQRYDSLACYGNDWLQAPNLNALADESFVFDAAYVTQPVCTPARASIMTGLYPQSTGLSRNNIPLPESVPVITEMAPEEYYSAHFGKWHLGNDTIRQRGFDHWVSVEDFHRRHYTKREYRNVEADYNQHLRDHGLEPPPWTVSYEGWVAGANLSEEVTQAGFLGKVASEFISDYSKSEHRDDPLLMYLNFFEPHPPYTGPLNGLYDPATLPVGPAFLERPDGGSLVNRLRADHYMGGGLNPLGAQGGDIHDTTTEAGWRKLRAQYFANVTLVDRQLAKVFGALKDAGMWDDTVIVFTSEHGEMAGDHGMLEKRSLYEEAARVPLLMRVPGLGRSHARIDGSFGQVDLVPTLLELMGQELPGHLQGKSRLPVLRGEETLLDSEAFVQWNGMGDRNLGSPAINRMVAVPWRGVVTGDRWKLNLSPGDQCELYNLNTDPAEMENLFDRPEHRDRVREMAARIRIWQQQTGDTMPLPAV
jgi:arylsulfatase A-like enzyme